jgi:DDE superfamily endonuclease
VLLALDETDLLLLPPLRAGWARRGQPAPVPISGQNARRTVFGSLNLRTGHMLFLAQKHKRAENFQAFLKLIHSHYRGWPVALLLDENSCHTAQGSLRLAHALGIQLVWLPKRSPHLNPVEHLWRDAKAVVCANLPGCFPGPSGGRLYRLPPKPFCHPAPSKGGSTLQKLLAPMGAALILTIHLVPAPLRG